ncbi:MAG: DUF459 domain-containing protein [Ilumatobacteraceae bacterium]
MAESFRTPASRRRVSRQRYLVRRLGVAVVAVLVVAGGVWGVSTLVGGPGEQIASGSAPETTEAASEPSVSTDVLPSDPSTIATASTASPTTVPPTTVAGPAPPTAAEPAKVLVVGDSDAGTFGPYLKELLDGTGVAETTVDYKVSSGLARPDFFDWPAHLTAELPTADPDIVVVTFGGNDAQGLALADGSFLNGDPVAAKEEWLPEYTRRAGEVMDLLAAVGRTVIWVGIPNDDSPEVTARLEIQDEAVRAAIATRPAVQFVDTWARFSSPNGGWAEYVIDPRDGLGKDVRAEDGFHLNENGAEILALDIAEVVKSDLRTRGATL